jgi:hypothetical protein
MYSRDVLKRYYVISKLHRKSIQIIELWISEEKVHLSRNFKPIGSGTVFLSIKYVL